MIFHVGPTEKAQLRAEELRQKILEELTPEELESNRVRNAVICVGGDGTLLDAIRRFPFSGNSFIPINAGTRGYLMNRTLPAEVEAWRFANQAYCVRQFPVLGCLDGQRAFNEVAVQPVPNRDGLMQACKLLVRVNGTPISREPVIGSGVMVSTAAGSTAYSMACGGSARHPLSSDLSLTFITSYSPRPDPIVIPEESQVTVEVVDPTYRPVMVVADGKPVLQQPRLLTISKTGTVGIAHWDDHNFIRRMIAKVIR